MRLDDIRESMNYSSRGGGGGGGMPGGAGGIGIVGVVLLSLVGYACGIDPRILIGAAETVTGGAGGRAPMEQVERPRPQQDRASLEQPSRQGAPAPQSQQGGDEVDRFLSRVVALNEDVWTKLLPEQANQRFNPAKVVRFQGGTRTACGAGQAAMGPFYCPGDRTVYLDASFFDQMKRKLGGGGDFAYAYVIAHEMGHHIQNEVGLLGRVQQAQRGMDQAQANGLQVRVELQADCYAGVWSHHADARYKVLEPGDIEEAMRTAAAIGDDQLQRQAGRAVRIDSFTHGSSRQRVNAFTAGMKSGDMRVCDQRRESRSGASRG